MTMWETITNAQGRNQTSITTKDIDGSNIEIRLTKTGWYEGFY